MGEPTRQKTAVSRLFVAAIPPEILSNCELSPLSKLVFGIVAGFALSGAKCFASNQTLACAVGTSPRTVKRAVRELVAAGVIRSEVVSAESNRRYLTLPTHSTKFGPTHSTKFGPTPSTKFGPTPSTKFGPTLVPNLAHISTNLSTISLLEETIPREAYEICNLLGLTEVEIGHLKQQFLAAGLAIADLVDAVLRYYTWCKKPKNRSQLEARDSHCQHILGWPMTMVAKKRSALTDLEAANSRKKRAGVRKKRFSESVTERTARDLGLTKNDGGECENR